MRTQTIVQLSDQLVAMLDERAQREGTSRSAIIRAAVEAWLADDADAAIDRAIIDGYRRHPPAIPTDLEEAAAIASIEAEPW